MSLVIFTIAAFGFSWILADSKVSYPLRTWLASKDRGQATPLKLLASFFLALLECVACTGFHVGWICQLAGVAPIDSWWMAALYVCGANLLLAKFVGMLDE